VARYGFSQRTTRREAIGMALVVCGVALLLLAY
jgi:drug/metabolite transporter (DMT)-like permease